VRNLGKAILVLVVVPLLVGVAQPFVGEYIQGRFKPLRYKIYKTTAEGSFKDNFGRDVDYCSVDVWNAAYVGALEDVRISFDAPNGTDFYGYRPSDPSAASEIKWEIEGRILYVASLRPNDHIGAFVGYLTQPKPVVCSPKVKYKEDEGVEVAYRAPWVTAVISSGLVIACFLALAWFKPEYVLRLGSIGRPTMPR
jgi:hypothetical protein